MDSITVEMHSQFQTTNLQALKHFHIAVKPTTARVGVVYYAI